MGDSFENFKAGMSALTDSFSNIRKQKLEQKKLDQKEADKQTVNQGISNFSNRLRDMGADPKLVDTIDAGMRAGGGKGADAYINTVLDQFSKPAKDHLNQLQTEITNARQQGPITKEQMAGYQQRFQAIVQTEDKLQGTLENQQAARKLGQDQKSAQMNSDVQMNQELYKTKLGVAAQVVKWQEYQRLKKEGKVQDYNLEKARVPQVLDKTIFPDRMNEAQVEQSIRNLNPHMSNENVHSLIWDYQNRNDKSKQFYIKNNQDNMQKSMLMDPATEPNKPNSPGVTTNPFDFEQQLNDLDTPD